LERTHALARAWSHNKTRMQRIILGRSWRALWRPCPCGSSRQILLFSSESQPLPPAVSLVNSNNQTRTAFGRRHLLPLLSDTTIPPHVATIVEEYAAKDQTSASLQMLMRTGRGELLGNAYKREEAKLGQRLATEPILLQTARFLQHEIPIRLAHRIVDLANVPMMRDMPSVQTVKEIYIDSFLEMLDYPQIHTPDDQADFADGLESLYAKHANVLVQMAKGAFQLRKAVRSGQVKGSRNNEDNDDDRHHVSFECMEECHKFLDRFYTSRIGIRVLAGQYLALHSNHASSGSSLSDDTPNKHDDKYIGMICLKTSPSAIVRRAASDATTMCLRKYGIAPRVVVQGRLDLTFPYIPTYLHYILLELLKNALRATTEHHASLAGPLPSVTVVIADGDDNEDVVIKIMDEGGGIPRSRIEKVWSYLYTTADPSIQEGFIGENDHSSASPIAGLGYGLPISRSYVRYFGGDMDLMSMEGYGTDAFLYLKRIGDSKEPLPV
jgi:pyruvate dehydrogenase kinase 2/3/4